MFYVIGELVGCIFWGVLIAVGLSVLLFFIPRLLNPNYSFSPLAIISLVVIFLFLSFQSTLLVGSIKVKGYLPTKKQILSILPEIKNEKFSLATFQATARELTADYPMLESFIETAAESLQGAGTNISSLADLADYYSNKIHSLVNKYMLRRIAWIAGGILLLTFYLYKDSSRQANTSRRRATTVRRRMPD